MEAQLTEQNKIRQVAKDYEKKGYTVIIEPRGANIPSFIKNYHPDLIASNNKETVIIEVKTRADYSTIERLKEIADLINNKEGWRFELIVINPRQTSHISAENIFEEYSKEEIKKNVDEIKQMVKQKQLAAAFILSWATLESLSRHLLLDDKKNLRNKTPLVIIKTLFSFGYVSRRDYETLDSLFKTRNEVVHGYKTKSLDKTAVEKTLDIIERMLTENR